MTLVLTTQQEQELVRRYQVYVPSDSMFQRHVRLMQSVWRDKHGYPIGDHRGKPLGSRLAMPWAEETLANYLSETIREVVRREVFSSENRQGKLFGYPRILNDLLSSQPLCFNLFGELQVDLKLASEVFAEITKGHVKQVMRIEFEHSPGRGDMDYTGDASAFDVYVEYLTTKETMGFYGIEVKYHENMQVIASRHRSRYDEISALMGCFKADALEALHKTPLQQIWRDHLLTGSLLNKDPRFDEGSFIFLYPKDNLCCEQAVKAYQQCLSSTTTFMPMTIEDMIIALQHHSNEEWVQELSCRYIDFSSIEYIIS